MGHVLAIESFIYQRRKSVRTDIVDNGKERQAPHAQERRAPSGTAASPSAVEVDVASLESVYRAHFTDVWHAARRLGGRPADLEDLTQEVFMTFWRTRDRFDSTRPLKPWLYGIAFRVVSDYRRKASFSREIPASQNEPLVPAQGARPDEAYAQKQRRDLVASALEALSDEQRVVFVMVDIEGYSAVEVSEALGLKLNTTYSRLRLGRKKFTETVKSLSSGGGGQ